MVNREPVLPTSRCLEQDCTSASCLASGQPKSSLSPSLGEPVGLWSHTSTNDKQLIPFRMAGFSQPKAQWTKVGTPNHRAEISQSPSCGHFSSAAATQAPGSLSPGLPAPSALQQHWWPAPLQGVRGPQQHPRGDRPCQPARGDLSTAHHLGTHHLQPP